MSITGGYYSGLLHITRSMVVVSLLLGGAVTPFWGGSGEAFAADVERSEIENFVKKVGTGALEIVHLEGKSDEERRAELVKFISENGAVTATAKFALGPFFRKMPAQEREVYYELAENFAANTMYGYLKAIPGINIQVTKVITRGKKKNQYVVFSEGRVPGREDKKLRLDWWLVNSGNAEKPDLKLFDFGYEGVWLAQGQRSVFVSLLKKNNGDFKQLYSFMSKTLKRASTQPEGPVQQAMATTGVTK